MFGNIRIANIGNRVRAGHLPIAPAIDRARSRRWRALGASPFGFVIARLAAGGITTDVAINALEQKGLARSLAEPNLVALSGDTASFLAGGEYPIPVAGSSARSPSTTRNTASAWPSPRPCSAAA